MASGGLAIIVQVMPRAEDTTGTGQLGICASCHDELPDYAFNRDATKRTGRYPHCKLCRSGVGAIFKVRLYRICAHCGKRFRPRHNKGRYVEHCSRPCATGQGAFKGQRNAMWQGDQINYAAAHRRIYTHRGKPTRCAHCDTTTAGMHWALDHDVCHNPLPSDEGPYSPDPGHYIPLCVPCHKAMDLRRLAALP